MISDTLEPSRLADGFPGQRIRVLPRPLVSRARTQPVTRLMLVTDAGFFPHAQRHGRARPRGAEEHVIIVCASGRGWCWLDDRQHEVKAGQVLTLPPGRPHSYEADADDPWTIWWIHVVGPGVEETLGTITSRPVVSTIVNPPRATSLIQSIVTRMEHDETASTLMACTGAAWNLLCLLAADHRPGAVGRTDPVEAVVEHLRATVSTRTSVSELAAMVGLSESHLAALFRRRTGFGLLEYQTRQRMALARELLDTTDRTIASIAREVGYDDPMYFSRRFRALHSTSPRDYRRRDSLSADGSAPLRDERRHTPHG